MTDERYRFDVPRNLLCRQDRDPAVVAVFGAAIGAIDLRDLNSHLELQAKGFDVVFKRAPFVVAADEVLNEDYLHVAAFHFRQEEHDGYAQYSLALPGNITFSDTSDTVRSKLGEPERVGGGAYLTLLKQIAPRFWHYPLGTDQLHIEFDNADRVHTVTCKSRDGLVNWLAAEACRTVSFANQTVAQAAAAIT